MLYSAEFDGIHGYVSVTLTDLDDNTQRIRLEHRITADQSRVNAGVEIPKSRYMPKRYGQVVIPTRIIEHVDVPKGRWVPSGVALDLVRKHLGRTATVEWGGRGWHICNI